MRGKIIAALALPALLLGACVSTRSGGAESWYALELRNPKGRVEVAEVKVDKLTGWLSIENEIRDMAPLLFLEGGFGGASPAAGPLYAAEIQAREREYIQGWKTRRSLSVEVRLRSAPAAEDTASLPLAAARIICLGKRSFSSSGVLNRMLDRAIGKALRALSRQTKKQERKERREQRAEEKRAEQNKGEETGLDVL
jgi:hypothetical protein